MDKRKLGFFNPSSGTFMVVENEEEFLLLLEQLAIRKKQQEDQEFKKRLEREKFDDFDYVVEEVEKAVNCSNGEQLLEYEL